jgi:hypothetical protein
MLNSTCANDLRWNRIQEPARPSGQSADLMRLLAALDTGWIIIGPVKLMPCEDAFGGQVFEITLHHLWTKETLGLQLVYRENVELFFREENIRVVRGNQTCQ